MSCRKQKIIILLLTIGIAVLICTNRSVTAGAEYFVLEFSPKIPDKAPFEISEIVPDPVLRKGEKEEWDGVDLLNPSVIKVGGQYWNYYSGFDGVSWKTGVAKSPDGRTWTKISKKPVLTINESDWDSRYISANGSAIEAGPNQIDYYFQGMDKNGVTQIGLAKSTDLINFTKLPKPVFTPGSKNSWDSKLVADPYVIRHGAYLYLYYLGQDDFGIQRLGVARSIDGINWERYRNNPIMDVGVSGAFDEKGLGEPSVIFSAPYFYMIYTGRNFNESRDLGYAVSLDGVNWKKMSYEGLFTAGNLRKEWNAHVICDSTLLQESNGEVLVWYGGGNKPEPAQNTDGQVGLFKIKLNQLTKLNGFDAEDFGSLESGYSQDIFKGSYAIESEPGGKKFSWIGAQGTVSIFGPKRDKVLNVLGYAPELYGQKADSGKKGITIQILIDEKLVRTEFLQPNAKFELTIPLAQVFKLGAQPENYIKITLKPDTTFIPVELGIAQDARELGVRIYSVTLKDPE